MLLADAIVTAALVGAVGIVVLAPYAAPQIRAWYRDRREVDAWTPD